MERQELAMTGDDAIKELEVRVYRTSSWEMYTDNFSVNELRCKCDKCKGNVPHQMEEYALRKHQLLRMVLGRAYTPNSAYRCPLHKDESKKKKPGEHTRTAMDIPVRGGAQRMAVVKAAHLVGATGIGVANSFIHVDFRSTAPMLWKY